MKVKALHRLVPRAENPVPLGVVLPTRWNPLLNFSKFLLAFSLRHFSKLIFYSINNFSFSRIFLRLLRIFHDFLRHFKNWPFPLTTVFRKIGQNHETQLDDKRLAIIW